MYRYYSNGKLITSAIPIRGLIPISMTDAEAKHCIGFDSNGIPIYNQAAIDAEIQTAKQKQIDVINAEFDKQCSSVGVSFTGSFITIDTNEVITNPSFQYDDLSQNRLLKFKDIVEVNFWRSVENKNVQMTNEQKNTLYSLLLITWATKFAEKSQRIDLL